MNLLPDLRSLTALLLLGGVLTTPMLAQAEFGALTQDVAPPVLLARNYQPGINPARYLVSEKLDGVRALWDGKSLRFRSGKLIHAPDWFIAKLPAHALDGELWMGRRSFERVSAAVRRLQADDAEWRAISYQIYEMPEGTGSFSERLAYLQQSLAQAQAPWLQLLPQMQLADAAGLQDKLREVTEAGGEGLMLHLAEAPWQSGRSDVLLKYKPYLDAEAKVIAHLPGKGKYQGMLGSLLVETADGIRFRVGSGLSDAQRRTPPAVGAMITYRYRDQTTKGVPRFATFLRVREEE
jgi:DNA ligase-1